MRKVIIRQLLKLIIRRMKANGGELSMKDVSRLHGTGFYYYMFVTGKLGTDSDPFFNDDYTECLFEYSIGQSGHLDSLHGRRLNMLFVFASAILLNYYLTVEKPLGLYLYFMSKAALGLGITIGWLIRWVYVPYVKYVAYPVSAFLEFLVALAYLMITTLIDLIDGR